MKFKTWLNEIKLGSDGQRDNAATQTSQATGDAANSFMQNPKFAPIQSQIASVDGSPSTQRNDLDHAVTTNFKKFVPTQIAPMTSPPAVAFNLQKQLNLKTGLKKPQFMVKR